MVTAGDRIRRLRLEKEMKQEDLAGCIQSSRFNISNYENGRPLPNDVLIAYAKYFDVSTDWILGLTQDRKPGGSDLTAALDALAAQVAANGGSPVSPDQLMQLFAALRAYYRAGAPAGNAPVEVLSVFLKALTDATDAARTGSTGDLLIATNAVASAGLQAQSILAQFLRQQDEK